MKGAFEIMTMGKPWRVGGEKGKSWAKETERVFSVKRKQKTFGLWGWGWLLGARSGGSRSLIPFDRDHAIRWIAIMDSV
ncbi:hypothetical protein [Acidiphilium rubrum]|uniref:hypothetical protein n=1 Tax=Acidiphilium rubrum TaxID=526 RepID=UPI00111555FC|nr:hypothetical protein [Acidiphilium rubrum]